MADEAAHLKIIVDTSQADATLDVTTLTMALTGALSACHGSVDVLDAVLDRLHAGLDASEVAVLRAQALACLAALHDATRQALDVAARQAARRAVEAYRATAGPVDTSEPD